MKTIGKGTGRETGRMTWHPKPSCKIKVPWPLLHHSDKDCWLAIFFCVQLKRCFWCKRKKLQLDLVTTKWLEYMWYVQRTLASEGYVFIKSFPAYTTESSPKEWGSTPTMRNRILCCQNRSKKYFWSEKSSSLGPGPGQDHRASLHPGEWMGT